MTLILNGTTGISGVDGSAATPAFKGTDANTGVSFGTDTVTINTGGVARVTTDASGNVGIGVTPSAWRSSDRKNLQILGGAVSAGEAFTVLYANAYLDVSAVSRYVYTGAASNYAQSSVGHVWSTAVSGTAGDAISFSERMRIDSSGNVGIGTASPTSGGKLDVNGVAYFGVADKVKIYSNNVLQTAGTLDVGTIGSAALNLITNNGTKATIDSSGNLGLGVTPSYQLDIQRSSVDTTINVQATTANQSSRVRLVGKNGSTDNEWNIVAAGAFLAGSQLRFTQGVWTNNPAMMIDSNSNVGIGTASPSAKLTVSSGEARIDLVATNGGGRNFNLYSGGGGNVGAGAFAIAEGGATQRFVIIGGGTGESARITSDGNLLVGVTGAASGSRLRVRSAGNTSSTYCVYIENSSASTLFYVRDDGEMYSPPTYSRTSGAASNVGIDAAGGFFRSTSSLKYKTDVQDATHGLADVMALRSVTYKGKNDGETVFGGLIAEEVDAAGLNEFVVYDAEGKPDALHYGNMVSLAFKAIQELKAEVDSLKAQLQGAA